MNEEEYREAAIEAIAGCERLVRQLDEARERVGLLIPIDAASLDRLPSKAWDVLYAFQMRFMLLQDLASRRLLRGFLALSGEDSRDLSYRAMVDRVAQLGGIAAADDWLALTAIRNQLAHDYPVDLAQFATRLDDAWSRYDPLVDNVRSLIRALKQLGLT